MWGWATWRRSLKTVKDTWANYDPEIALGNDPIIKKNLHLPVLYDGNDLWIKYWQQLFIKVHENKINTWDYQWCYTILKTSTFCIRPSNGYVVNIGSGEQATHHTFDEAPIFNFVYTAEHYDDRKPKKLKIDFNYEIFNVGAIVNSHYFKSFTKKYFILYLKNKINHLKTRFRI